MCFLLAASAQAAVDGVVTNSSTGKPQAGATVTLFQPTQQGPQFIDSVKTDAQGKFQITKEVPAGGAGPLLLQAVYAGVQYNKMLPPGTPTSDVQIPVYESSKRPGRCEDRSAHDPARACFERQPAGERKLRFQERRQDDVERSG